MNIKTINSFVIFAGIMCLKYYDFFNDSGQGLSHVQRDMD